MSTSLRGCKHDMGNRRLFLFGKLSIDVKHYSMIVNVVSRIFTKGSFLDTRSSKDHVLGFFSKIDFSSNLGSLAIHESRKKSYMTVITLDHDVAGKIMACS